ncbi:phytanoyl-CoA dioxygenase family protein [Sphingomonas sp. MG17]|uniref:Phytanoyl-CoA dioxygenase family protein n=1 Tax=Sphingomonas tagetis TaxID=2949092 RepID=A0A9X2HPT5_9SPHN|nr:phytanoyl-CoA dioxygenase family protein [Sphingomonas tagetis]MCP3731313.1 phytanoyl-CoA dioxygenase family protein [Sphingomonas tagetis]
MNMAATASAAPQAATSAADIHLQQLLDEGYCIIPEATSPRAVQSLSEDLARPFAETPCSQGPFYGSWTKRFHGLLGRSGHMDAFVRNPLILSIVEQILAPGYECIQLNLTQAIEILPGGKMQPPHRDQDMWPVRQPGLEYLVNVMWPFTPYSADNGATIVWPGSHKRQDEIVLDPQDAIAAEMAPGAALLFLGSTLHAGGANHTAHSRRGMIVSYSLGWLKPYELPWLAYPPELARTFPRGLAELAGYRSHRPNLGTYEGRCASDLLETGRRRKGAVDALRPEHEALIERFYAGEFGLGADGEASGIRV